MLFQVLWWNLLINEGNILIWTNVSSLKKQGVQIFYAWRNHTITIIFQTCLFFGMPLGYCLWYCLWRDSGVLLNEMFLIYDLFCPTVFNLFLDSMQDCNTDVLENVTLPCLKILANSIQKATKASEEKVIFALLVLCLHFLLLDLRQRFLGCEVAAFLRMKWSLIVKEIGFLQLKRNKS